MRADYLMCFFSGVALGVAIVLLDHRIKERLGAREACEPWSECCAACSCAKEGK